MNLLVLDTALVRCSVGVVSDAGRPVLMSQEIGRGHAERLFEMMAAAMDAAGVAFQSLDRVAATVGPGSFTGMRVGIAAARGLGLATHAETVGIGTLAALAARARTLAGPKPVLAMLDARREQIYAQPFDSAGEPLAAPGVGRPETLFHLLSNGMVVAGSGVRLFQEALGKDTVLDIVHDEAAPDIGAVVDLARTSKGLLDLRPVYLRPADAKPQRAAGLRG